MLGCYRKCFREKFFIQTKFRLKPKKNSFSPAQYGLQAKYCWYRKKTYSFNYCLVVKRERCCVFFYFQVGVDCRYIDESGEKYIIATFALKADTNFFLLVLFLSFVLPHSDRSKTSYFMLWSIFSFFLKWLCDRMSIQNGLCVVGEFNMQILIFNMVKWRRNTDKIMNFTFQSLFLWLGTKIMAQEIDATNGLKWRFFFCLIRMKSDCLWNKILSLRLWKNLILFNETEKT